MAAKIADGHAFTAHASEFGVASKEEFSALVRAAIGDPSAEVIDLPRGRTAFYVRSSNTLAIVDTNHPDLGTMFRPTTGESYIDDLRSDK